MRTDSSHYDDEETLRTRVPVATAGSVRWAARSSIGRRRSDNQDAWGERRGTRFVVADGVGSLSGGSIASAAAVAEFLTVAADVDWTDAIAQIDEAVRLQCSSRGVPDAATTIVGCEVDGDTLRLVHVGDSRAYRLRAYELECLTADHNLANLRAAEGLPPDAEDGRGRAGALTSFLGHGGADLTVDCLVTDLRPGDRVLLCSDGVHGQLDDHTLAALLSSPDPDRAAERLVQASDEAGGRDNATALVICRPDGT